MFSVDARVEVEIDGRQIKFDNDLFYCESFELINRCYSISNGRMRLISERSGGIAAMDNGISWLGKKAVVKYSSGLKSSIIFSGFVAGIKSYNEGGKTSVDLLLSSPEFWLLSGRTSISWNVDGTYSNILNQIFSNYSSKFERFNIEFSYDLPKSLIKLHDSNENDYDYVKRVARSTGFLFYSLDGTVKFRPIEADSSYSFKFKFDGNIGENAFVKKIKFNSNITSIPKSVSTSYIKEDDYENPLALKNDSFGKIGNGRSADDLVSNIDDNTTFVFSNLNVDSDETAKYLSKAEYKRRSINLVNCEITCGIWPELKVGSQISLSNFSNAIDNSYIITSLTHKFENFGDKIIFSTVISMNTDAVPYAF